MCFFFFNLGRGLARAMASDGRLPFTLDITPDLLDPINGSWSSEASQSFTGGGDDKGSDWFLVSDFSPRPKKLKETAIDEKVIRNFLIMSWHSHCRGLRKAFEENGIKPFDDPLKKAVPERPIGRVRHEQ